MNGRTLSTIFIVIAFLVGAGLGVLYQGQNAPSGAEQSDYTKNIAKTAAVLNSKFVPLAAQGTIDSVNGRELTITQGGTDKAVVKVADGAKVYSITAPASGSTQPTSTEVNFDTLKKGDDVDVQLKITDDGNLQGQTVYIYPAQANQQQPSK